MTRRLIFIVAVIGAISIAIGAVGVSASTRAGKSVTVVERAETDTVVDLGAPGDSLGDLLVFGNDIYNAANTTKVGRDQGSCVRTNPGMSWECSWTTILTGGSISVAGPFYDDLRDTEFAITGGTGKYRNARGVMILHSQDALGTVLTFTFRIIG
ncbi:MAG: dirigent protein [Candidatus Limnocylindrales bacterium]